MRIHRIVLRTSRTPLRRLWTLAYRAVARAAGAYLTWGERGAATYVRGGLGRGELLPGLSDIDLAIVAARDGDRIRERWQRLERAVPATKLLVDAPRVYDEVELRELSGASAFTYALDPDKPVRTAAAYMEDGGLLDRRRTLERPGLYGVTADWRLVAGPDRRPPAEAPDTQLRRVAAWLELLYWWRWVPAVCMDPSGPRTAGLCVKLVTEPARAWLWLAHGIRPRDGREVLEQARRMLPEEEPAFRRALELQRSLPDSPAPPLADALPALVRLSDRIARLIAAEVEAEGVTEVRLAGAEPAELLPLVDWRGVACPAPREELFTSVHGDPGDPAAIRAAAVADEGEPYRALRAGELMILPTRTFRGGWLRTLKCSVSDPVSFALAGGERVAAFPRVSGWSAEDLARRAVAEHRGRLQAGVDLSLATLWRAARAALLLQSLEEGDPELPLTASETARQLGSGSLAGEQGASARHALRKAVLDLPAYNSTPVRIRT